MKPKVDPKFRGAKGGNGGKKNKGSAFFTSDTYSYDTENNIDWHIKGYRTTVHKAEVGQHILTGSKVQKIWNEQKKQNIKNQTVAAGIRAQV